jgi:monofunctional biosynthetic peptidoglycan transglycosylase
VAARTALVLLLGPLALILLFRFLPVPLTPLMVIRVLQGYGLHHSWIAYDRIAPVLARAVVASEDNFFCREALGFDEDALLGEIDAWWQGDRPRGASTITMQTARTLLLWPGRDFVRKGIEAWFTPQIALLWPKRRILEVYLNSVEFGPGIYGAEAAAQHYFHRHAADLTDDQAARLAVILPDPLEWSADRPGPYLLERVGIIERRIAQIAPLLHCTDQGWRLMQNAPIQAGRGRHRPPARNREPGRAARLPRSYQGRLARTRRTTDSITGTSTRTPTTVASAAPD